MEYVRRTVRCDIRYILRVILMHRFMRVDLYREGERMASGRVAVLTAFVQTKLMWHPFIRGSAKAFRPSAIQSYQAISREVDDYCIVQQA